MREFFFLGLLLVVYFILLVDLDIEFVYRLYSLEEIWFSEFGNGGWVLWFRFEVKGDWLEISYLNVK